MKMEDEMMCHKKYECDPKKAKGCKKTVCYITGGGECRLTHKKEWAKDPEDPWNDAEDPPKDDRFVLISFENCPVPCIGRYREEMEGGAYYEGDEERSLISYGFVVNGWMELPKCRRRG